MNLKSLSGYLWVLGALCSTSCVADAQVEEIYIVRSVRDSRVAPSEFCAPEKTGFGPVYEDRYSFRSISTQASDGRLTSADVKTIGTSRACFGRNADKVMSRFYMELQLGGKMLTWRGDCPQTRSDFPEQGVGVMHCLMELIDSKGLYSGGQLTTNTMMSRNPLGTTSDPPGYTQPSIATIRLWRQRAR